MARLFSMTGFGASAGSADWGNWTIEARSVNGRGLDVRVNVPPGFDALEPRVRQGAKARFERGNLQVSLRIEAGDGAADVEVNEAALNKLAETLDRMPGRFGRRPSRHLLATLMTINGVVSSRSGPDLRALAARDGVMDTLASGVDTALEALRSSRGDEGRVIEPVLGGLIRDMRAASEAARKAAVSLPNDLKTRLMERLDELGGLDGLSEGRLESEAALLAARADVREELDRLDAHFDSAATLIADGSPAGRKLGFLSQEIGREANTLCSKSASLDLTNAGLELKSLNDQLKEQVANVE